MAVACEKEMGLEATELRLGLPGGGGGGDGGEATKSSCKRGFEETIDLKLKLETTSSSAVDTKTAGGADSMKRCPSHNNLLPASAASDPAKPPVAK